MYSNQKRYNLRNEEQSKPDEFYTLRFDSDDINASNQRLISDEMPKEAKCCLQTKNKSTEKAHIASCTKIPIHRRVIKREYCEQAQQECSDICSQAKAVLIKKKSPYRGDARGSAPSSLLELASYSSNSLGSSNFSFRSKSLERQCSLASINQLSVDQTHRNNISSKSNKITNNQRNKNENTFILPVLPETKQKDATVCPIKYNGTQNIRKNDEKQRNFPATITKSSTTDSYSSTDYESTRKPNGNNIESLSPIHMEFLYYSAMLKELAPKLSEEKDRQKIIPWLKKVFRPEYMTNILQQKRNKYLMLMMLSVLNDEVYNVLGSTPPVGALPDIETLSTSGIPPGEWEKAKIWKAYSTDGGDASKKFVCHIHVNKTECVNDNKWDKLLDDEFAYLLYLAKPYTFILKNSEMKSKIDAWFRKLSQVPHSCCCTVKGIRNDYIMAMLGYLQDLQTFGPFQEYPNDGPLLPLKYTAKTFAQNQILNPESTQAQSFLINQPFPTEGAYCYMAVTGDLVLDKNV